MTKPANIKKIEPDFDAVQTWFDSHLSTNKCNFDDPKPYEVYEKGLWGGIFQCLAGDTPIMMGDGSMKPIEDVTIGDRVIAYDAHGHHYVSKRVTAKYDQGTRECITLKFFDGGETLTCTPDHPILNATSRVFAEAESLAGSLVVAWMVHRRVDKIVPAGMRHVYDLEVEDVHTFVAAGVVVHNCTGRGAQQLFMKAKPKTIVDIAALTSIYRPGPLAANVDKLWMQHETDHFDWGHPLINETLKQTRGCLAAGTMIMTNDGEVSIEEIVERQLTPSLPTFNETTHEFEADQIIASVFNGIKETLIIETTEGEIEVTGDHPIMTQRGWVAASDLTINDYIVSLQDYISIKKGVER